MKKTSQIIVMAALCLNFCYGQETKKCADSKNTVKTNHQASQPYKYAFSGFKSGYKCGYRITDDEFMKGKSITVRNYTIIQLFALAMGAGNKTCPVVPAERICVDVREPNKLNQVRCYQLVVPFYLSDNFYIIMQQSLNEEFPDYIVEMEKRAELNCMVIKDREY